MITATTTIKQLTGEKFIAIPTVHTKVSAWGKVHNASITKWELYERLEIEANGHGSQICTYYVESDAIYFEESELKPVDMLDLVRFINNLRHQNCRTPIS